LQVAAPPALQRPDLRLTVDSPEDLEFMRRIMSNLGNPLTEPTLAEIIDVASSLSPFSEAAAS
jgi:spore coat polysaccharide biosynthesis protein SpsF (cytidylyltransferase family)